MAGRRFATIGLLCAAGAIVLSPSALAAEPTFVNGESQPVFSTNSAQVP